MIGNDIYNLAKRLFPINRSLTGDGVRQTFAILQEYMPALKTYEVPSGTVAFDWVVPKEWRVNEAYIITPDGQKICDFKTHNLHLVGYSTPVKTTLSLDELQNHLYSLPEQPDAIPYITSYYKERWGFCITHQQRDALKEGDYQIVVDSELFDGNLTYGELIIKGQSEKEIFLSTYICHPSMANNELSGPVVTTHLAKWLAERANNKFTYRIVFIPETIGSIVYLSKNKDEMRARIVAGFNITCVGDNRTYSYLPSRHGQTISDDIAQHVLKHICPDYATYHWNDRGSDERQYCAPGVDLPIASIMRTKYGMYDEYHTSLDDLRLVTAEGLGGAYHALQCAIEAIENNCYPQMNVFCEPQLGKRGLYPTISTKTSGAEVRLMMNLITWSDGTKSLLEIADICAVPIWELYPIVQKLAEHDLLSLYDEAI